VGVGLRGEFEIPSVRAAIKFLEDCMEPRRAFALFASLALSSMLFAAAKQANVRGIVHDPQHRPIAEAKVDLRSAGHVRTTITNSDGEFEFQSVLPGRYNIEARASGFAPLVESIQVKETGNPVYHLWMKVAAVTATVRVSGAPSLLSTETSTTQTLVNRQEITQTPGADQANSLAMITDFVPGAYMVHDMLHVRGGHQENWYFDGIPVLNTNIASNVGPVINPMDVDSLQVQTGGYSSEYGDRTYGFFNVVTPSGFNRNNEGELITSYGNFNQTDDFLSFGSHTERLAYFASLDGDRSDLGLDTPTSAVIRDQTGGLGGFASLLYNPSAENQFRVVASLQGNDYQIPNTPEMQLTGIRDTDVERDDILGLTWSHSSPGGITLTVSPYLHFNRADYVGGPNDTPFVLNDNRRSTYVGTLATVAMQKAKNNSTLGIDVWGQHDDTFFSLAAHPGDQRLSEKFLPWGNSESVFAEDRYSATSWLSFNGGVRLTHYNGLVNENAADPRLGAALRIPRVNWVLHGYYAQYYQQPPLDTVSGPLLSFAVTQGYNFISLPGERDRQWDVGLSVPYHKWFLNIDHFRTSAANFLDHDEVGNSDVFLPLTDLAALISGTETTLRSPEIFGLASLQILWSNQLAKGLGPITGGLIEFAPVGYFYLDHDQRNTVSTVLNFHLPLRTWATADYEFGSGFLNGNGPAHFPPRSVVDLALGKSLGKRFSASANALNLGNARFMLDNSNTFGGTHYVDPRGFYVELRWRFHY
jgi:Carboxypeptidase regulatory-like domain/TonB dependent receptor/TonB-dependent Receptor Plug Domain